MASASFRESLNSLGWARRDADIPVNTSRQSGLWSSIKSLNPFGDSGYVQLPTTESAGAPLPASNRREEEEGWFACESGRFFCCCLFSATVSCCSSLLTLSYTPALLPPPALSSPQTSYPPAHVHPMARCWDMCRLCMPIACPCFHSAPTRKATCLSCSISCLMSLPAIIARRYVD